MDMDAGENYMSHEEHMDIRMSNDLDLNVEHGCRSTKSSSFNGQYSNLEIIKLGLEFESDEHAYTFYNRYAELAGFGIRKDWVNRSKVHGRIMSRKFTCSRQGHRKKDKRDVNVKKHRKETRTGCLAHMVVTRQPNGRYRVTQFDIDHNHDDVNLGEAQKLLESPLSGKAESIEIFECDTVKNSEIQSKLSLQLLGVRFCPPADFDDPQISDDIFLGTGRTRDIPEGDASRLLYYFERQHFRNPSFFYSVQLDFDDKVSNIFWADDHMIVEYGHFGDVICLDTSSSRDKDTRPFVQLIGLNHHRHVVIFGAAFLYDDNVNSFKWLFQTFVNVMSGKKPKFILSDHDATIVQAIHAVLPETSHSICAWQMYLIALKHLRHVITEFDSFALDFRSCIFCHEQEDDFIQAWDSMLEKHGMRQNAWLRWMFREKEKWAIAYGRNTFFIERNGTHLAEEMAKKQRTYLSPGFDVLQFFKYFESIVNEQRYKELESNFDMGRHAPIVMANAVLLKQPSLLYTPKAFELFQREYEKSLNVVINKCAERDSRVNYKAKTYGKFRDLLLVYNSHDGTVSCNCMKFEHAGLLCSHALRVLDHQNIKDVPLCYILKRWTRDARILPVLEHHQEEDNRKVIATRYKDLCRNIIKISARAAESDPAFEFAAKKLDEVMLGVERILNFKPDEDARGTCASENILDGIGLVGNDFEGQDIDILKVTDEMEGVVPDKDHLNHCNEHINVRPSGAEAILTVGQAHPLYISSESPTPSMSTLTQSLYAVEANHMVHGMYQASNLSITQQPSAAVYDPQSLYSNQHHSPNHDQFLQDSMIGNHFHDPISNGTHLKQVLGDSQHPHSSSFMQYQHRYRAAGV